MDQARSGTAARIVRSLAKKTPITTLLLSCATSVVAADLSARLPPNLSTPASPWTGFYIGVGVGPRVSHTDANTTFDSFGVTIPNISGRPTDQTLDGTAVRGSPYVGFNWQFAPQWVAGVEGDFGFADQTTTLAGYSFTPGAGDHSQDAADSFAARTSWDASLRGRLGFLATPTTLVYATGGAAWLHEEVTSTCASNTQCVLDGFLPAVITNSATRLGWTLGGGIETALWGHWLARAEYRYADFGSPSFAVIRSSTIKAFNPTIDTFDLAVRTHTVTFGLAYKLGDPIQDDTSSRPVKARVKAAPAAVSWSGVYAGLGLGVRASRTDATKTSDNTVPPFNSGNADTLPLDGVAFRGSPYLGYNWQFAPVWVAGLEGDVGLADRTTTLGGIEFAPGGGQTTNAPDGGNDGLSVRNTWDASLRGRLGYLVTPILMVYGTAGVAWQHFDVTSTCVSPSFCVLNGFTPAVISFSTTRTGGTVGGGIETALWRHWLARAEYRYADLGTASYNLSRAFTTNKGGVRSENFDLTERTHTVTFGLAYKLD